MDGGSSVGMTHLAVSNQGVGWWKCTSNSEFHTKKERTSYSAKRLHWGWSETFYRNIWYTEHCSVSCWLCLLLFLEFHLVEFWEICFPDKSLFFIRQIIRGNFIPLYKFYSTNLCLSGKYYITSLSIDYLTERIDFSIHIGKMIIVFQK